MIPGIDRWATCLSWEKPLDGYQRSNALQIPSVGARLSLSPEIRDPCRFHECLCCEAVGVVELQPAEQDSFHEQLLDGGGLRPGQLAREALDLTGRRLFEGEVISRDEPNPSLLRVRCNIAVVFPQLRSCIQQFPEPRQDFLIALPGSFDQPVQVVDDRRFIG
jgi:hypothetical protein